VPALLGAVVCLLALALLLDARPGIPTHAPSSPSDLEFLRTVLSIAAWGVSIALAGLLLLRSVEALFTRRRRRDTPRLVDRGRRPSLAHARLAQGTLQSRFPSPFPLVLRRCIDPPRAERRALVVAVVKEYGPTALDDSPEIAEPASIDGAELRTPSIDVLGPLKIVPATRGSRGLRSDTQQFLAYLALHPDGGTTDELVAAFWPDVDFGKARKRLWRSVSEVRAQLGDVIHRPDERYVLDRRAVAIDVDEFESLLERAEEEEGDTRTDLTERALDLARGRPLAGGDYPWAAGDIRRLSASVVDRLEYLGRQKLKGGNAAAALAAAEKALAFDADHEAAQRLAMEAEGALGLRQAIADRYERLTRELGARFGLEPERETRLLYRRLLGQDAAHSRPG
jgi:DNA-binding SARP family transcriptional activator